MYESETYDVTGANDVLAVIEWARGEAGNRTFTVEAAFTRGRDAGMLLVYGLNPTVPPATLEQETEVHRLFVEHGYSGEVKMVPVTSVDERVFVLRLDELGALRDIDQLATALERVLDAPVRIVTERS